jgi:hypothetical protein
MSREIFNRYWKNRYADSPNEQPEDDTNIPLEHLKKYHRAPVLMTIIGDIFFTTRGNFIYGDGAIGIEWSGGDLYTSTHHLGRLYWDNEDQTYTFRNPKFVLSLKLL